MNSRKLKMLLAFMPEFLGIWVAIIVIALLISVMKSNYCEGLNLLETTRCEALFNRAESVGILVVALFCLSSIGVRSWINIGDYFWPAAFLFGFIIGGVFWGLYVFSESHTLAGRNVLQIVKIVIIPGTLISGLCGLLATLFGLTTYKVTRRLSSNRH